MKENFPSKLLLFQEGLEICKPVYLPMSSTEELRRQISCLLTLKEEGRSLTSDEIEDLLYTLQFAEKYRIIQQQMIEAEEEIIKLQSVCRTSENEVEGLTHEWKQLNDEYVLTLREFQNSQNQLEELKKQLIVQESKPVKRHQPNVVVISNDHVLNSQRTDYVSLRNRSLSGDKGTAGWNNDLTS